jgi:hypothetical protein
MGDKQSTDGRAGGIGESVVFGCDIAFRRGAPFCQSTLQRPSSVRSCALNALRYEAFLRPCSPLPRQPLRGLPAESWAMDMTIQIPDDLATRPISLRPEISRLTVDQRRRTCSSSQQSPVSTRTM